MRGTPKIIASFALTIFAATSPIDSVVLRLPGTVLTGTLLPCAGPTAPIAYSVVERRSVATTRRISLADALGGIPGPFVQSRGGSQDMRVTIRGFGARGNASGLYGNASDGVSHLQSRLNFERLFVRYEQRAGDFGFHREQAEIGLAAGHTRGTFTLATTALEGWRQHSQSDATIAQLGLAAPISDRGRLVVPADGSSTLNRFPGAHPDRIPPQSEAGRPELRVARRTPLQSHRAHRRQFRAGARREPERRRRAAGRATQAATLRT